MLFKDCNRIKYGSANCVFKFNKTNLIILSLDLDSGENFSFPFFKEIDKDGFK
jgi:hypothetical protein